MKYDDPVHKLYDLYSKPQLQSIAKHNNVPFKNTMRKLEICRAIISEVGEGYEIPDILPLVQVVGGPKTGTPSTKESHDYRAAKGEMIDEQWRKVLPPDEFEKMPSHSLRRRRAQRKAEGTPEKIAVYCKRNVSWDGVGQLKRGYNFVSKEEAEKWLTIRGVREATADEVRLHFNL